MDSLNVDAVIVGNIGVHARAALAAYGIVWTSCRLLRKFQTMPQSFSCTVSFLFLSDEGGCGWLLRLLGRLRRSRPRRW